MRSAQYDIAVQRGDDVKVVFDLAIEIGGGRLPLILPDQGVFDLAVMWAGGQIAKSSAAGGLAWDPARGRLTWLAAAADTGRLPLGRLASWRLSLTDPVGGHRTYLTGKVTGADGVAFGDVSLALTIVEGVAVTVTVEDAAGGSTLAQQFFLYSLLLG